jgi:hypothetical protein
VVSSMAVAKVAVAGWQWLGGSGGGSGLNCGHFETNFVGIGALLSEL